MTAKRLLDLLLGTIGLVVLSPLMVGIGFWIRWDSPGPVFFRQIRVGQGGRLFSIYKFRTMIVGADGRGKKLTIANDERITMAGGKLRRYKLDELPQLLNVLRGEMSLVGPRPEVPEYVACYPDDLKEKVLSVPPGITDNASIAFAGEADLLANADSPTDYYVSHILPEKLALYAAYVDKQSLVGDMKLIFKTICKVVRL